MFVFSIVGAYGPDQSLMDVWVMLVFGVVGFVFRRFGFSPAPLVMGLVLGKMTEETLKQSLLIFDQNWAAFPRLLLAEMALLAWILAVTARGRAEEVREPVPPMVYGIAALEDEKLDVARRGRHAP